MALSYGTSGIKQKDYRVYIAPTSNSGVISAYNTYNSNRNKTNINALIDLLTEFGECRADSISVTAENGDTIEGNVLGEIVLNKTCSMVAELINGTPDNLNALTDWDGTPLTVVVIEKDTHLVSSNPTKTAIVITGINMSYAENITGGDSIRATIKLSRNVAAVTDFRSIADINFA